MYVSPVGAAVVLSGLPVLLDFPFGITTVRGEYIMGQQPGTSSTSTSPAAQPTSDCYIRNFNGAYFYFLQNIMQTKHQLVFKYDWYDPNVKIAGKEIGKAGTNTKIGDIRFDTYGFGITYRMNTYVKLMTYYDLVRNEETLIAGYAKDIKDNVVTVRMQFRF